MIRLLIADDHQLFRQGLKRLLSDYADMTVVAEAADVGEVMLAVRSQEIDVVILDLTMPGRDGVEMVAHVKAQKPLVKVLVLTMCGDESVVLRAVQAGANGYMLKRTPTKELIEAIREVQRGGSPMTAHIARLVVQSFQRTPGAQQAADELSKLSEREQQVLDLLSQGLIYKEIAEKLKISYESVHTYIRRIYEKLQVRTRTEAVAKFLQR